MTTTSVALATVQETIARAIECARSDRSRIERAAALLATGHVDQIDATTYAVRSQTDDTVTYTVTPDGCGCVDAQRKASLRCKHDWSVRILLSAQISEQRQAEQAERATVSADRVAIAYARSIGWAA